MNKKQWVPIGHVECPFCHQIHDATQQNLYYNCQTTNVTCWNCRNKFSIKLHIQYHYFVEKNEKY